VSPDEGGAGGEQEILRAPDLKRFGLTSPDPLFGIDLRYQIAQKLHACTDPHTELECANIRARALVDLIRGMITREGIPAPAALREAGVIVFEARVREHEHLGLNSRPWPPNVVAHDHWEADYAGSRSTPQPGGNFYRRKSFGQRYEDPEGHARPSRKWLPASEIAASISPC